VIGYGYTKSVPPQNGMFARLTSFRCAVRLYGGQFNDSLVDEEFIESFDPSVSLLGQGSSMTICYAYEASAGAKLKLSNDAGGTFGPAVGIGNGTAFQPNVFVRNQGGLTRLDVLFLERRDMGTELRVMHWDDYDGTTAGTEYTLVETTSRPVSGGTGELEVTSVAWLGYDAVLDGDDVVIVCDEHTFDAWFYCGPPFVLVGAPTASAASAPFAAATPPPLAAGMTQALPAPDPADQHQLKCIVMD
jgi:hypothetical protein